MNSAMENYEKDGDEKECVLIVLGIFLFYFIFKSLQNKGLAVLQSLILKRFFRD